MLSSGRAGAKALRPTASAGVVRATVLQVTVRDPAMRMAPRRLVVAFAAPRWRRCVGASIHFEGLGGREASSAPPSPSRHDQWRFLRCVWICVIAIARERSWTWTASADATTRLDGVRAFLRVARLRARSWSWDAASATCLDEDRFQLEKTLDTHTRESSPLLRWAQTL